MNASTRIFRQIQSACARRFWMLPIVLGIAIILLTLVVMLVTPVHALFTAESATATNTITVAEDLEGQGDKRVFESVSVQVLPLEEENEALAGEADKPAKTSDEGDKPKKPEDPSGEQPGEQSEGVAKTETSPVVVPEEPVVIVEPVTPATPPSTAATPAEEKNTVTVTPKTTKSQGEETTGAQGDSDD